MQHAPGGAQGPSRAVELLEQWTKALRDLDALRIAHREISGRFSEIQRRLNEEHLGLEQLRLQEAYEEAEQEALED